MKRHWAEEFMKFAERRGVDCTISRRLNGWIETSVIAGRRCFTKSVTYLSGPKEYFVGVDPRKLEEDGDAVLLCGGAAGRLRDVFVIPWDVFFDTVRGGAPINSFRKRVYLQYKLHVRDREGTWIMAVQPGHRARLDVGKWRYDPVDALEALKKL